MIEISKLLYEIVCLSHIFTALSTQSVGGVVRVVKNLNYGISMEHTGCGLSETGGGRCRNGYTLLMSQGKRSPKECVFSDDTINYYNLGRPGPLLWTGQLGSVYLGRRWWSTFIPLLLLCPPSSRERSLWGNWGNAIAISFSSSCPVFKDSFITEKPWSTRKWIDLFSGDLIFLINWMCIFLIYAGIVFAFCHYVTNTNLVFIEDLWMSPSITCLKNK